MLPYLLLISVPGLLAVVGMRRPTVILFLLALIFWVMIGFRFKVGMDWNNYLSIYSGSKNLSLSELLFRPEPGFKLLMWIANRVGGGIYLINAISGLVFCWGYFHFARRCPEPLMAVVVGTPLVVVAFAMSGTRQAMALGIIFYLYATWNDRTLAGRIGLVVLASLFHFSSIFVLIFVALSARAPLTLRVGAATFIGLVIVLIIYFAPESMEAYSRLYVSGRGRLEAPGAIAHVGVLAAAALAYFLYRKQWVQVNGDDPVLHNLAVAALMAVPGVYFSSVGAYRFALYLWPMAMSVWSGMTYLMHDSTTRLLYRLLVVLASVALLVGWLTLANNSVAWVPYQNWLLQHVSTSPWR